MLNTDLAQLSPDGAIKSRGAFERVALPQLHNTIALTNGATDRNATALSAIDRDPARREIERLLEHVNANHLHTIREREPPAGGDTDIDTDVNDPRLC